MALSDTIGGIKNSVVDLFGGGNDKVLPYDVRALKAKRQQALADQLRQQASAPIDTFSYDGVQAPIPWTAVLAKALTGVASSVKESRAEKDQADLSKEGTDATRALYGDYFKNLLGDTAPAPGAAADITAPASPGPATPVPVPGAGAPDDGLPPAPGAAPAAQPPMPGQPAPIVAGAPPGAAPPPAPPPGAPAPITAAPVAGAAPPPGAPSPTAQPLPSEKYAAVISALSGEHGEAAAAAAARVMPEIIKGLRAEKLLKGLDLTQLPDDVAANVKARMAAGDIEGALKEAQEGGKPTPVGNDLIQRGPGGKIKVLYKNDPGDIDAYKFAQTPEGGNFKGSLADWYATKAQRTHVTVNTGDNLAMPTTIGYTDKDGNEVQTAASWDKKTGKFINAENGMPIEGVKDIRVIGNAANSRSAAVLGRVVTAALDVASDSENLASVRVGGKGGLWDNMNSTPLGALTRKLTDQEAADVQSASRGLGRAMGLLAGSGLAGTSGLAGSYEKLMPLAGQSQLTVMRNLASLRQQAVNGIEGAMSSPLLAKGQKELLQRAKDQIEKSVPWLPKDVQALQDRGKPNQSMRDIYAKRLGVNKPKADPEIEKLIEAAKAGGAK